MSTKDEALKLALDALEESKTNNDTMEFHGRKNKAITAIKQALAAHVQEPEYRCCPHTSDCAVHNMPAYPAGPCNCGYSSTFNLPPSTEIHEVCLKLAERELDKLTGENFGRTPSDTWANKVVKVYHFFDSNPKAKKLAEIYIA